MRSHNVFFVFCAISTADHMRYFVSIHQIFMFVKRLLINVRDTELDIGGGEDGRVSMEGFKQFPKLYSKLESSNFIS